MNIIENPFYLRDHKLLDRLLHALKDEGPAFIYVEKYGVHFPYSTKYPPDFHKFSTPAQNGFLRNVLLSRANPTLDRDVMVTQYEDAIAWSVNEFFIQLLPAVDLSKTLIIYTSDHGQNLLPGRGSHCSTTQPIPPGEANVPLFAITSVPEFEQRLETGAAGGFGRFSHFEVFPTLLLAMGYDEGWVNRTYGPSLLDSPPPDRKFMIGSPGFQPMMIPADSQAQTGGDVRTAPRADAPQLKQPDRLR